MRDPRALCEQALKLLRILGIGDLHLPIGWGDIPWDDIFSELSFLPDTALIMEIGAERFRDQQPACLTRAQELAQMVVRR